VFTTVYRKVLRFALVLLLAATLLSPIVASPAYAGDCPTNGSTSCG